MLGTNRVWILLWVVVAALAVSSCDGGGNETGETQNTAETAAAGTQKHARDIDVCALVSADELGSILGTPVEAGERQPLSGVHPAWGCTASTPYDSPDEAPVVNVSIQLSTWDQPDELDSYLASLAEGSGQAVAGIADTAYWNGMIMARKGTLQLNVHISGDHEFDPAALRSKTVEVAKLAASRI